MKKQIAILTTIMATAGLSAFGQGFMTLGTGTHTLYNDVSGTAGTATSGSFDIAFLWAATGTSDPLGTGIATTGSQTVSQADIADINSMLGAGWQEGANTTAGNYAIGTTANLDSSTYNGGSPFALYGSSSAANTTYEMVAIAWNNEGGTVTTLSEALAGTTLGFTSSFNYLMGTSATDPNAAYNFSQQNPVMSPFGVVNIAPAPEPTTLALAGLGGLSMLFLRRRKA